MTTGVDTPTLRETLSPIVRGRRRQIAAMSMTSLGSALAEAAVLVMITQIGFALAKGQDEMTLPFGPVKLSAGVTPVIVLALALVLVRGALQTLYGWQSTRLVAQYLAATRKAFARAFVNASLVEQTRRRSGELQELLTTFAGQGAKVMNEVSKGTVSVFSLIALIGTAIAVSPLASIGLLVTMALLGFTLFPLRRVMRSSARRAASTDLEFATSVNEFAGLGREMQVFGVEAAIADELDQTIEESARASQRLNFQGFLFSPFYATVLLLLLVGSLTIVKALHLTDLATLGAVILVMLRSMAYAQQAQGVVTSLHASAPYVADLEHRLAALEDAQVPTSGRPVTSVVPLRARDLSFEYTPGVPALSDLDFSIDSGEIIGVVGPSGSGKSTLVQLLLRLRTPTGGSIEADGTPIGGYSLTSWRERTAFVPQDARLIHASVADNIRFFRSGYSDDAVMAAARLAHIHEDIERWSLGYDTLLGASEHTLSGGQQQRICIARALLSQPDLLIMDEPTSALDVQSEAKIRDAVSTLRGSTTVVIIAHRLSTVEICDRIMVIENGKLVGFDSPANLRESDAFYRDALELSGLAD